MAVATPRLRPFWRPVRTDDAHRPTMLELFFDVVYVYAFTQVSGIIIHTSTEVGVLQALVMLGLLWWTWSNAGWFANQTRADIGFARAGLLTTMAVVLVMSLSIGDAYSETPGINEAALVIAAGFFVVRVILGVTYIAAAGDDTALRRQVIRSMVSATLPSTALLVTGAVVGGVAQTIMWEGAFILDALIIYATSVRGNWRIHSAGHFTERHALVVILALGESVVAIGTSTQNSTLSPLLVGAVVLAFVLSVALWWAYFGRLYSATGRALAATRGARRSRMGMEAYTYLHLPLIAGIIITAAGVEAVVAHPESDTLGLFWALCLFVGAATYLLASAFVWHREVRTWPAVRIGTGAVLLGLAFVAQWLPALASLALVVVTLGVMLAGERYLGSAEPAEAPESV